MNELNFFQSWLHRILILISDAAYAAEKWGQRLEQKPNKQVDQKSNIKQGLNYEQKKEEQSRTIKILGQDVKVKRGKGIY